MPARHLGWGEVKEIADIFNVTNFEGGRHEKRVNKNWYYKTMKK